MRAKKTVAMVVILMGILGVFALGSSAEAGWYNCTVNRVGMGSGTCYINLTDMAGAFTYRWFMADPSHYKELMAVALTAITNDMPVEVIVESAEYSVLSNMYLGK